MDCDDGETLWNQLPAEEPPPAGWSRRDWSVLLELARGDQAQVGFQGLKRRLNLHPEALSRCLSRLVESGEVVKTKEGYRLSGQGHAHVAGAAPPWSQRPPMTVAALLLPSDVTAQAITQRFSGRWFDGLYWYGTQPGNPDVAMKWITDSDTFVTLRTEMGFLRIEASGHEEPDRLVQATAPLVAAVASWLRGDAGHKTRAAS